jgi:hypothetical protein
MEFRPRFFQPKQLKKSKTDIIFTQGKRGAMPLFCLVFCIFTKDINITKIFEGILMQLIKKIKEIENF